MSENTKWTAEQSDAITEKDCSLLVAAAAGAGKTAVLVERIIRRITDDNDPVDIDRLLVVTFTNAAATEMRERIAGAISAALEGNPGSKNIRRQLTLLNKASITTMHSFCLDVIRNNFQSIGIDPGFRIADETEATLMKLEVLNELFEEQYEKEDENRGFYELLECYGGNRDDQALQDMVLNLYGFVQSSPWPRKWLDEMAGRFNSHAVKDFGETPWGRVLLEAVMLELEGLKGMLFHALEALDSAVGLEKYRAVFIEDLSKLEALQKQAKQENRPPVSKQGDGSPVSLLWDDLYNRFQSLEFSRLPAAGKDCDREKQEFARGIRDDVKARLKKLREGIFSADSGGILSDLEALQPVMMCLTGLVSEFGERYAKKKSSRSVVDFNDLEHFCLEILSGKDENGKPAPSEAALAYRERFAEILVDEYQDSNLVQESIISLISRADTDKPNVFMVGDVKQSIYRFRQARPELFMEKYETYSAEKGKPCRKILLYRNFRSRREVVDAVNFIFKQIMSVRAGELDYTDTEALNSGAAFAENDDESALVGGEAELHIIQTGGKEEAEAENGESGDEREEAEVEADEEEMPDSIQCEARLAAGRIRELMLPDEQGRQFRIFDREKKGYRKLEYRDIVILLRTTRNWSDVFMEEMTSRGIPAFADTGTGFFKTSEVQVVLSLLQIIDNPLQDIPLLSVLRSPICAFTTDELAELRLADRKSALFDALKKLAETDGGEASEKASAFLEKLLAWRDMAMYMSTDRLLWQLYSETGYYGMVGALPAGEQRQANLRILYERARQFEETSYKGLFNFISFIDKLKSSRGDMGSAKILGENDNVVRIMSIHKSKGLEFPVVILSGCGKKFNLQDMNKSILLHQELGLGPDVVDHRERLSYPSVPKLAIREKIKSETLSEEMRILYVALTRAREKLIITGAVSDISKAAAKWAQCAGVRDDRLPAYEMLKGGRYLDWIGPALLRHKGCGGLREASGVGNGFRGALIDDPSLWQIRIWNKSDIQGGRPNQAQDEKDLLQWLDSPANTWQDNGLQEKITAMLDWDYPYMEASRVPAKVSVTELKRRFDSAFSEDMGTLPESLPALVRKPGFLEERKGLSAAEAGTILHFVMQHLDFRKGGIEAQVREMTAKALLTEQQAQSVDIAMIRRFLDSPLGSRLLAAGSVNREVPFNMEIPCGELYRDRRDGAWKDETILLQGVIDCYFEEPDGIVLLDYKTDYVPDGKTEMIRDRYRLQIGYYARALELLTGRRVKERFIYLFRSGEVLEM
jgi:ATP-dependent helicase/nuclease subunit A